VAGDDDEFGQRLLDILAVDPEQRLARLHGLPGLVDE